MNTPAVTNKFFAVLGGITVALIIAACSSGSLNETEPSNSGVAGSDSGFPPGTSPMPQRAERQDGDEQALEEITVSGNPIAADGVATDSTPSAPPAGASEPARNLRELLEQVEQVEQGRTAAGENSQQRIRQFRQLNRANGFANSGGLGIAGVAPNQQLLDAAALARVLPGEEVWIISQSTTVAQVSQDDSPGTGAMLASLVWPDDTPPARRHAQEVPLPLQHTDVHAQITGYVSTVDVTQQFANPFDQKIEAVYLFPLPQNAAVREFVMSIGERRIRGILREKEQAEAIYAQARAQGYQASLLTQHRPNIFEQKVANIEPGHQIDVNIRYFHTLSYDDGWYSFVFPTVVGPRYNPPGSTDPVAALPRDNQPASGAGVHFLSPHERSGHDISITVDVAPGVAIEEIDSTHAISRAFESDDVASVTLARAATIPNRDFILNFRVAGSQIKSNLLTWVDPQTQQGYFTMMMYPPSDLQSLQRQALELVFVLDCSGSMSGAPMEQSKAAILAALRELRPDDTFQIIRFSSDASQLGPVPVKATRENIRRAEQYVRNLSGTGGTQMIEGIKAALDFEHDPERLRFVTFLTDGYIGNELEILGAIHERLGSARIFSFGVGSSPNRYLLERMAGVGRGAVAYLGLQDSGSEVMDYFFDRIAHPAMLEPTIDWNGMQVADVYPARLPDLFVGKSVVVTGRFTGDIAVPIVRGHAAGHDLAIELPAAAHSDAHAFIAPIWARQRIAELEDRRAWENDGTGELESEILSTALAHNLMSDYTAFVAVDASRVTEGTQGTTVFQAVPVPQGVRYETTVAR